MHSPAGSLPEIRKKLVNPNPETIPGLLCEIDWASYFFGEDEWFSRGPDNVKKRVQWEINWLGWVVGETFAENLVRKMGEEWKHLVLSEEELIILLTSNAIPCSAYCLSRNQKNTYIAQVVKTAGLAKVSFCDLNEDRPIHPFWPLIMRNLA